MVLSGQLLLKLLTAGMAGSLLLKLDKAKSAVRVIPPKRVVDANSARGLSSRPYLP